MGHRQHHVRTRLRELPAGVPALAGLHCDYTIQEAACRALLLQNDLFLKYQQQYGQQLLFVDASFQLNPGVSGPPKACLGESVRTLACVNRREASASAPQKVHLVGPVHSPGFVHE
jgi:hypothetical protein